MGTTSNGALHYESGQQFQPFEAMSTDDNKTFEASFAPFSGRSGFEPVIRPYGLATGGVVTPTSGQNDQVDVAALTAYMAGNVGADSDGLVSVAADGGVEITRAVATDTHIINSITVDDSGAVAVIAGTDGTAFSETRGAAGGPPLIPVGRIEIGQVRLSSNVAAPVTAGEIYQVPGTHLERWDFPVIQRTESAFGQIVFAAELPEIHTGGVPKKVFVKGYTPIFAELSRVRDFVPAETSHSVNSTDYYDGPLGSVSATIGQGSFVAALTDGITDPIVQLKNQRLWFKWFQDRNRSAHVLTQGVLGLGRTFPVNDHTQGNFTISAESASTDKAS
jgi:hypothetical protein